MIELELLLKGVKVDFSSLENLEYKSDKNLHNLRHSVNDEFVWRVPQEIKIYDREMMQVVLNILKNAHDNFREKSSIFSQLMKTVITK